jgi:hypothetical protein
MVVFRSFLVPLVPNIGVEGHADDDAEVDLRDREPVLAGRW